MTPGVRLSPDELRTGLGTLFGPIDPDTAEALALQAEWVTLQTGEVLCRQGDPGDVLYVLLSGRLRAVHRGPDGQDRVVWEFTRADCVGEMEFFTGAPRKATVYTMRDSVVLAFSRERFDDVAARHPQVTTGVIRLLVDRLQKATTVAKSAVPQVSNVAVVPIHADFPTADFAARLVTALSVHGPTGHLSSGRVDALLGVPGVAQTRAGDPEGPRLAAWLDQQESAHRFVVYEADQGPSDWTRRCIRQADRIVLVAHAGGDPSPGAIEQALSDAEERVTAHRTLVLLHPGGTRIPSGTQRWRAARPVRDHLHLRWNSDGDFARLARVLTGRAVGLVLGGGGARGFAHIGVIRALREAGVPIDMVGGTSMGAAIAAQCAMGWDYDTMLANNRRVWLEMRPHYQVTLPVISFVANRKATSCAQMLYGDVEIEDCWSDFFCVSSNLTTAEMVVHRSGPLRAVTMASASLPVFAPPILDGRHLLVDGGLVNNLPCDVMRELGAGRVVACEVSLEEDETFTVERVPSPWELLRGRFRSRVGAVRFPSLVEVLLRSTMLGSIRREAEALRCVDLRLDPPVEQFGLLDFAALDQIARVGYDYARRRLEEWEGTWH